MKVKIVAKVILGICLVPFIVLLTFGVVDYKKTMIDFEKPSFAGFSLSNRSNRKDGDYMGTGVGYRIYMHADTHEDGSYEFTSVEFNVFGIKLHKQR